jgi:DNA-binding NarL/FixJ family response regulator
VPERDPEHLPRQVRVLIADDHPLFRDGLRLLLESTTELRVIGEAGSGDEAVALATEPSAAPDVVVMDLKMPGLSGIEATRQIRATTPRVHVLIVTMFEDDASILAAMRAGARGYVLKDAAQEDILRAIHSVARGEAIFSPAIASRVLDSFVGTTSAVPREAFPMLTEREREILHALARGCSNGEIAAQLALTSKTVRNYISAVLSKLEVVDRTEAILRAREAGLGRQPVDTCPGQSLTLTAKLLHLRRHSRCCSAPTARGAAVSRPPSPKARPSASAADQARQRIGHQAGEHQHDQVRHHGPPARRARRRRRPARSAARTIWLRRRRRSAPGAGPG